MDHKKIFIRRVPGDKIQAVRINSREDIPNFLWRRVSADEKNVYLYLGDKEESAPLGSVLIYDYLEPRLSKCALYETLPKGIFEENGVFYKESPVLEAVKIEKVLPDFMKNARITYYEDCYVVVIRGGVARIEPGDEGYFALYGYDADGAPLVDVILKYSYSNYILCDEDGNYLKPLI